MPALLCVTAMAASLPAAANASVFELFGADARGVAMAGALAAASDGAEAAFYNPAALHDAASNGMQLAIGATALPLSIRLLRPVCRDDLATCHAQHGGPTARQSALLPNGGAHLQLGWHARHHRVLGGRLAFGTLLTLPATRLIHISGPDATQPHFALYESLPDRLSVLLALAARLHDRVLVGVGVQVLAALGSELELALDPQNGRIDPGAVRIGLQPTARWTVGTLARLGAGLRLGVGVRQEVSLRYRIPSDIGAGRLASAKLLVAQNTLYSPTTLDLGLSWRSADARWWLATGLRVALWSGAPDPSPQLAIDVGGGAIAGLGLEGVADVGRGQPALRLGYGDTVSASTAVEGWLRPWLALRAGYAFRPTPAPRATGATSFLDNDAHVLGLGAELGFGARVVDPSPAPGEVARQRHAFYVRIGAQAQLLPRRTVYKRDSNDPIGPLDHGGAALHGVAQLGARF